MLILLYRCTTWMLTKCMEKSLTAITQECCEQYWTSSGGSSPQSTSCTATDHPSQKLSMLDETDMQDTAGEVGMNSCDILLWTPSHGQAKTGRPARTYIPQLCANTGCGLEDLLGAMDDRDRWQERVREIYAGRTTWWWWCKYIYIYIFNANFFLLMVI